MATENPRRACMQVGLSALPLCGASASSGTVVRARASDGNRVEEREKPAFGGVAGPSD